MNRWKGGIFTKNFGCLLIFILLIVAVVYFLFSTPDGPLNFDKSVFVTIETDTERGLLRIDVVLNPDQTVSMSQNIKGRDLSGGQGTWQRIREGNPAKLQLLFSSPGAQGHVDLYNNHEAVLGLGSYKFFGKWHQD